MKKIRLSVIMVFCMTLIFSMCQIVGNAAGPLDGQTVDGSLLTSDSEASDEQPLVPANPFEGGIVPYGTYISSGTANIQKEGNYGVYISGATYCYKTSDQVEVNLYLQKLSNGSWNTVQIQTHKAYDTYYTSVGVGFAVQKGYYYRVQGSHLARKGDIVETCTTCTGAVYVG